MSNAEQLGAEQAADLAALESMAGEGVQPVGEVQEVVESVEPDLEGEFVDLLAMLVPFGAQIYPSLGVNLAPERVKVPCMTAAALCKKRGWFKNGLVGGEHAEEIACAFTTIPLAIAVYKGIQADIAASKPAQPVAGPGELNLSAPVPTEQAGAKTVSVGAAI